jgi:hypothetical protein
MAFIFQQPGTTKLLEAINDAALNAKEGGGIFAFASKGGIEALFACPQISVMLQAGRPFHLIVGIDAITNAEALLCLSEKLLQYRDVLTTEVFLHLHINSTFHPKFSWFEGETDLRLVVGSGNLTLRGLGQLSTSVPASGNWEAFTVQSLEKNEAEIVKRQIEDWLTSQRALGTLCSLDDERVRNKAMANGQVRFTTNSPVREELIVTDRGPVRTLHQESKPLDGIEFDTPEVLIRELPKNRPGQADVGQNALRQFFGYEGSPKKILVQYVSNINELGVTHELLLFVNQSKNYRLELSAMSNLRYEIAENGGRMILVATKFDRRSFRYTVLPVTSHDYQFVERIFNSTSGGLDGVRPMREKRISPRELFTAWPSVPSNLLPLNLAIPEP